jgi:hypothetical protein
VALLCESGGEGNAYNQAAFEPPPRYRSIEVKPGERMHLNQWAGLPSNFKAVKQACRIQLELEDGKWIESREFVP